LSRLGFLDDDRAALQDAARQLLDRGLRSLVGFCFHERKATRASGFAIE
jgi:hypothetical protein